MFTLSLQVTLPLSEWQEKEAGTPALHLHAEAAETLLLFICLFINRPDDKKTYMLSVKLR